MKIYLYWHDWMWGYITTREWKSFWIGPLAIFWDEKHDGGEGDERE